MQYSSLYVHIPFCKSRCIYCGFYSTTLLDRQEQYVDALLKELELRSDYLAPHSVKTIYLGGGTPSMLKPECLERLCRALTSSHLIYNIEEFTMECNPDDVTDNYAQLMHSLGINRVSMGAQTFSNERLAFLHRRHKAGDVRRAVETLRRNGIQNISIDLMFGFPGETLEDWESDIREAMSLNVEHISAYSLMYEEGTSLFRLLERGDICEISEETSLAMYESLIALLTAHGYEHYEISNFARPGFRSQHNSNYWRQVPYLGLGASAHSYNLSSRQWNIADVKGYVGCLLSTSASDCSASDCSALTTAEPCSALTTAEPCSINLKKSEHEAKSYIEEIETLTETEKYNDIVTTALRTREGINLTVLSPADRDFILKAAQSQLTLGNLTLTDNHLHLTHQGLFISDSVMVDLIKED